MNVFMKTLTYFATFAAGVVGGGYAVQKYFERQMSRNMENAKKMLAQMNEETGNQEPTMAQMPNNPASGLNVVSGAPETATTPNPAFNVKRSEIVPLNITAESIGRKSLTI